LPQEFVVTLAGDDLNHSSQRVKACAGAVTPPLMAALVHLRQLGANRLTFGC
jgi:hypothetical protein